MGNIITNTSSLTTALDLADGNAKIKKDLSVTGKSTFTGDSTFNGNLSVTNGKFNSVDVPALNTDVTKLKTDMTTVNTTLTSVSAGSFTGKAISGATDVTATGLGTFNAVKTNNIDINGDILSTTGKAYIKGTTAGTASSLSLTNGMPSTNAAYANINLQSDGIVQLTHGTGKSINLGSSIKVVNNALQGVGAFETTGMLNAKGGLYVGTGDAVANLDVTGTTTMAGRVSMYGALEVRGGITVPTGKSVTTDSLTVNGTSTHTGASTFAGAVTTSGALTASGGITVPTGKSVTTDSLTVNGTSTHTGASTFAGAVTTSGALTANGGITVPTGQFITTADVIRANGGITVPTGKTVTTDGLTVNGISSHTGASTFSGDLNAKNVVIGTNKWVIEEVVDANKGNRLCFGKADAQGTKTYWTCMNNTGNLELF